MGQPVVHGPSFSTYVRSVRLALHEKGVEHKLVEVDLLGGAHKKAPYASLQPFGKVPAFEHDGNSFYETSAILRYIDEVFPGPALMPSTPAARALANQVMSIVDSYGYGPSVTNLFIPRVLVPSMGGETDMAKVEAAKEPAALFVKELERLLGGQTFFGGASVCLADLHTLPVLVYLRATPEGKAMLDSAPKLSSWMGRMLERASVRAMMPS
ncbi:MAG TPA: glutathione S-transferase family protein [Polyangiaceae bacterium]|nr:glutathione S-transferase family protein [Polyangiaceae bacterium]